MPMIMSLPSMVLTSSRSDSVLASVVVTSSPRSLILYYYMLFCKLQKLHLSTRHDALGFKVVCRFRILYKSVENLACVG